jgi:hypothetical protein
LNICLHLPDHTTYTLLLCRLSVQFMYYLFHHSIFLSLYDKRKQNTFLFSSISASFIISIKYEETLSWLFINSKTCFKCRKFVKWNVN